MTKVVTSWQRRKEGRNIRLNLTTLTEGKGGREKTQTVLRKRERGKKDPRERSRYKWLRELERNGTAAVEKMYTFVFHSFFFFPPASNTRQDQLPKEQNENLSGPS